MTRQNRIHKYRVELEKKTKYFIRKYGSYPDFNINAAMRKHQPIENRKWWKEHWLSAERYDGGK